MRQGCTIRTALSLLSKVCRPSDKFALVAVSPASMPTAASAGRAVIQGGLSSSRWLRAAAECDTVTFDCAPQTRRLELSPKVDKANKWLARMESIAETMRDGLAARKARFKELRKFTQTTLTNRFRE